jgi:Arc/MetJ-type ribon-helix-helix transcriptional regulator
MSYQLPQDLDQRVKAQMLSSGMRSEDDVLRAALDALEQLEDIKSRRWKAGNELALQQSLEGLSKPLDVDSLLARVEERATRQPANQ